MHARTVVFYLALAAALAGNPEPGVADTSLQVPVGARALGMGGAFSAIADDGTAIFWNPAGLPWLGHQEISLSHADLYGSGIRDDFISFILPLTSNQAAAVDWYQSGYDDDELGFGESRIDLAYGRKFGSTVSVGAGVKYLQRHVDLDGSTVRRGSGFGLDVGVLFRPLRTLRVSAVVQDAFDTQLDYSDGNGSSIAYPRTTRVGAAFLPKSWGTFAVDFDDRFHAGLELRPIGPIAIRSGLQTDFGGAGDHMFSFGAGVRWNVFRLDYALVDHVDLGSTSHFGLAISFNFNPSKIQIEKVDAKPIYSSLYRTYAKVPFGTVRLKNLDDAPVTARLKVFVPDVMSAPSEQEVLLRPHSTEDFPITAVFPDRIVQRTGDRPVQVQVSATYQSLRLPRTEKSSTQSVIYGPGAIDWSDGVDQAAAYVTTRDPAVEAFARGAVLGLDPMGATSGHRNLDFAAAIFDAVATMGVNYVPDPNNPYATISGVPKAVDTVRYPRQTLAIRTGDCDDTSVLLAALFGNVGIRTMFVDVPGHIFLLVNTGIHERNRFVLGMDESRYVVQNDEVWIPLETTALSKGFAEAWEIGAESYRSWEARGRIELIDVGLAQSRYEPGVPAGEIVLPTLDTKALQTDLTRDLSAIATAREVHFAQRYGETRSDRIATPEALNEVARVYYSVGRWSEAKAQLVRALASGTGESRTLNNLGAVFAAEGGLEKAAEAFQAAADLDQGDPGIWLNLGIARYAMGDSVNAETAFARGLDRSGSFEEACALLGLAPEPDITREGAKRMTAEEARELLRASLRRVPRSADRVVPPSAAPASKAPKRWAARTAGARSSDGANLADLLYWKT